MAKTYRFRPSGPVDFGVIGESFTLLFSRWQEYLLMGFISCLLPALAIIVYMLVLFSVVFAAGDALDPVTMIGIQLTAYPLLFGAALLSMPCLGGIVVYTLKLVQTGDAAISDFWGEWSTASRWYVLGLCLTGWYVLGMLACVIGSYAVFALLFFAMPIMAHEDLSPSEAIRESYERLKPHFWSALGLSIVASIISSLGQLACYVGYVFTFPLYFMVPAMAYAKWLVPVQQAPSASPYPRPDQAGYGAPPAQPLEEAPGPPMDEPPRTE